jgi:hypothetical protein
LRHGLPTDPVNLTLDGRKGNKNEVGQPIYKVCRECSSLVSRGVVECECGYRWPRSAPSLMPSERDGELQRLVQRTAPHGRDVRRDDYLQLLIFARARSYQVGWAAHQYRAAHGVWPRGFKELRDEIEGLSPTEAAHRFHRLRGREPRHYRDLSPHLYQAILNNKEKVS